MTQTHALSHTSQRSVQRRTVVLAAAPAGVLAACAGTGGETKPSALRSDVTLTLVHFYPVAQQDNIKRRIALFQQEAPGLSVNEVMLANGAAYRDRLTALFAGDLPPDVMHMSAAPGSGYSFGVFAPLGRFFDLGPLARRDRYDLDDFYKVALDFNSFGGKLFVMPNDLNVFATYWAEQLFRQTGAAPPPTDWRATGFDQAALLDAARRLTDRSAGSGSERFGFLVQGNINSTLPFLWSNGADVVSKDLRRITLDESAALETLQFIADAVLKHQVSPASDELTAGGGANNLFFRNRIGMHHTGSNFVNQLRTSAKDLAFDVGVSPPVDEMAVHASGGTVLVERVRGRRGWVVRRDGGDPVPDDALPSGQTTTDHFIDVILGRTDSRIPLVDALISVQIVEAAYESARTQKTVVIG